MLEVIMEAVSNLMGLSLEAHDLHWYHMVAGASVAYVLVLALVRLGHKRFPGKGSAFDVHSRNTAGFGRKPRYHG
jgi:hypothetical protein